MSKSGGHTPFLRLPMAANLSTYPCSTPQPHDYEYTCLASLVRESRTAVIDAKTNLT